MNREIYTACTVIHITPSDFIIDVPTANFKSDYSCEMLVKYHVKIMGDCLERQDATASKVLTSLNCSYGVNCKIMVIKHAEERNHYWHLGTEIPCCGTEYLMLE